MATSIIPQTQGMISVERVQIASSSSVSTNSARHLENVSLAKTGYKMLGATSVFVEGSGQTYCFCSVMSFDLSNQTIDCYLRNVGSSSATVDVYAIVIYEKL